MATPLRAFMLKLAGNPIPGPMTRLLSLAALLPLLTLPAFAQATHEFSDRGPTGFMVPGFGGALSTGPMVPRYPQLQWPLEQPLGQGTFLSNYVDDDQGQSSVTDYMGGHDHLYDDHRGTDIALYNFRIMDRGVAVVAAAGGTVIATTYHFGDRNTTTPYPDGGNGLSIQHDDGTRAFYWHVRQNSIMVEPGERVEKGQPLAYVASSGWTPIPHLHFELSGARDPWEGTYNTLPTLWEDQPPYVGTAPLWIMDARVFTLDAVGGNTDGITDRAVKERISQPAVVSSAETELYAWVQPQGNWDDRLAVSLIDPGGSVVSEDGQALGRKTRYGWFAFSLDLGGETPHGSWRLRVANGDGDVLFEQPFEVGDETEYGPRFRPIAGRSLRMGGGDFSETLWAAPIGSTVTYELLDAPSNVSLDGQEVTIGGSSDQPFRSRFFQVIAKDEAARTDTMWYHLVDPSKPFNPAPGSTAKEEVEVPERGFRLSQNHPNPVMDSTTIEFALDEAGSVRLTVFDLLGREIQTLVDEVMLPGLHRVGFDSRGLPSGNYSYVLETPRGRASRQLSVIR